MASKNGIACDGKTPIYSFTTPGLPDMVSAVSFEALYSELVKLKIESMDPVEGFDEIMKHYKTTFGRTPDAFMSKVVTETKERLFTWWGAHREDIRAALVEATPLNAPAQQTAEPHADEVRLELLIDLRDALALCRDWSDPDSEDDAGVFPFRQVNRVLKIADDFLNGLEDIKAKGAQGEPGAGE